MYYRGYPVEKRHLRSFVKLLFIAITKLSFGDFAQDNMHSENNLLLSANPAKKCLT